MERMSEHTGLISSDQLLISVTCTNTGRNMKGSHPVQLTGAHLYLDFAKSGYLFQGLFSGMWLSDSAAVNQKACLKIE